MKIIKHTLCSNERRNERFDDFTASSSRRTYCTYSNVERIAAERYNVFIDRKSSAQSTGTKTAVSRPFFPEAAVIISVAARIEYRHATDRKRVVDGTYRTPNYVRTNARVRISKTVAPSAPFGLNGVRDI